MVLGDGEIRIEQGSCIHCGLCAPACHHAAILVEGDRERTRQALAAGNAILILGTEAEVFFHPAGLGQIVNACRMLGFRQVYSSALGDELVAREYLKIWATLDGGTVVRSTDPVAVEYIRRKYPELLRLLAPVVTPASAAARYLRVAYGSKQMFIAFAGPGAIAGPEGDAGVDASITLQDLTALIEERGIEPLELSRELTALPQERRRHLSMPGGLPLPMLAGERLNSMRVRRVRGLSDVSAVARAMAKGEALGFVDVTAWDGSLAHPSMGPPEDLFVRKRIARAVEPRRSTRSVLDDSVSVDLRTAYEPVVADAGLGPVSEAQLDQVLAEIGTGPNGRPWDSGACGYATCRDFADAVVRGRATLLMCPQALKRRADQATEHAAVDALTGLHSFRMFQERLDGEVSRIARRGGRLALLVVDMDAFKLVNDSRGHEAGNRMLRASGQAIARLVRKSDFAARWGGDEFAVILLDADPGGAMIVAEKMLEAIARIEPPPGPPPPVRISASVGIATAIGRGGGELNATALFDAADRALYEAKRRGGSQIVLGREFA